MSDPKFDQVEHQLVPGMLRGYRQWTHTLGGGMGSMNLGLPWNPGRNKALHIEDGYSGWALNRLSHPAPMRGCTCGFYAHHSPNSYLRYSSTHGSITGSIKAYGRIILGDSGFKAEYAEIEALVLPSLHREKIQDNYPGVPVFDSFTDLVREFPPIPVDELLGAREPEPPLWDPIWLQRIGTITSTMVLTEDQVKSLYDALGIKITDGIEEEQ